MYFIKTIVTFILQKRMCPLIPKKHMCKLKTRIKIDRALVRAPASDRRYS